MGHLFLDLFLGNSFSFLFIPRQNFFQNFSPKFLLISILLSTFAIARIYMWSTPHKQRARMYVQAQPTLYNRCGLIFLPVTFRIHGVYALCLCGALHIMWRCKYKIYGGSPSTCFLALCGGSHVSSSRRGSASRFFRTPTSDRTRRIRA